MKLTKLSEYVYEKYLNLSIKEGYTLGIFSKDVITYTNFITQNLSEHYYINGVKCHSLNRFIPTDEEGNVLEEPEIRRIQISPDEWEEDYDKQEVLEYQKALDRCLFEGCMYDEEGWLVCNNGENTIKIWDNGPLEDLCKLGLTLTPTAIKTIGQ